MTAIIYEKLEASWLDGLPELSFDVRVQLLSRVAHQYIGHFGRAAPRTRQSYFFAIHEGFEIFKSERAANANCLCRIASPKEPMWVGAQVP